MIDIDPPPQRAAPCPRAKAHCGSAQSGPRSARSLATALLLLALSACGAQSDAGKAHGGSATSSAARIQALLDAYEPVPLEATSDKHDAALRRQREMLAELLEGDRELGLAALAAFRAHSGEREEVRSALLEVAACCDPQGSATLLEHMVVSYDPELGLGLRTHAARLLAQTSPQRALELLEPLLLAEHPNVTLPPREALVRAWATAAHARGLKEARVLTDVACDLAQPADARYAAIDSLAGFGGALTRSALETVLFEQSSDAFLRRKAAQALEAFLAPAELCQILAQASSHEHDEVLMLFLSSMMDRNCP